jgi:DNA-binding NarL/FixJ family response regulator
MRLSSRAVVAGNRLEETIGQRYGFARQARPKVLRPLDSRYTNRVMTMWSPTAESGTVESWKKLGLTQRELDVVAAVLGGCSNKEIAQELSISRTAVVQELVEVSHKLGVHGRLELALFVAHHRLLAARGS